MNNDKKNNEIALVIAIGGSVMTVIVMYLVANLLAYSDIMSEQYIGIIITVLWIGTAMFFTSSYAKTIPTSSNGTTCFFCLILILTAFIVNYCCIYTTQALVLPFEPLRNTQAVGYTIIGITGLWIK